MGPRFEVPSSFLSTVLRIATVANVKPDIFGKIGKYDFDRRISVSVNFQCSLEFPFVSVGPIPLVVDLNSEKLHL